MLMVGSQDVKQVLPHPSIVIKDWDFEQDSWINE